MDITLTPRKGAYILYLSPEECCVLIGGTRNQLTRRFSILKTLSYEDAERMALSKLKRNETTKQKVISDFTVNAEDIRFIDLRSVVNSHYEDKVAGDGKGGWTDQGRKLSAVCSLGN